MVAYEIIERLEDRVSKFLNKESYTHSLSQGSLKRELDIMFENSTNGIITDLENDFDFLYQQDCDITIDGFRHEMEVLQQRVEALKMQFERAKGLPVDQEDDLQRMKIQASFCERMASFIDKLIAKVEDWRSTALTSREAEICFFENARFDEDELPKIYDNLILHQWIIKSKTSFDDFFYLFTGKGFRPTQHVVWRKTEDDLCLFLEEMTFDAKDLTKAALIFEKKTRKEGYQMVKRSQLSAVRARINNKRPLDKEAKLKIMYRDIFKYPDWQELAKFRGFENFNATIMKNNPAN